MEQVPIRLQDRLEEIKVIEYLQNIDKLHLVSFISQIPLPIALFDYDARFLGLNQKFADIYESDALFLFDKLLSNFSTVVFAHFKEAIVYFSDQRSYFEREFYVKGKFYLSYFKALRNQNNEIEKILVVCSDVTRLKRRENVLIQNNKKLHDHLYLDQVTGLQNALSFDHYLSELWQKNTPIHVSFLKIDIDNFKAFNRLNSYTHGDDILLQLANVLTEEIAQTDIQLFRSNSASFIVIIENRTEWAVTTLAERFKYAIESQRISFVENDEFLTASVGIYNYQHQGDIEMPHQHESLKDDASNGREVDILRKLELAVRSAKELGKNSLYQFKE